MKSELPQNKKFGTIFNDDGSNILVAMDGKNSTAEDYQRVVHTIMDAKPGVFAQDVGMPDPVKYRSEVATIFHKYRVEVHPLVWPDSNVDAETRVHDFMNTLLESGTDPLTLTIEVCRERDVPVVASYRMNSEDWYFQSHMLSDFGRKHPQWRIPLTQQDKLALAEHGITEHEMSGALDPAIPEVYEHRMKIFTEVAQKHDIDGIEFDFRRWAHMISNPLENHPILTRLVRDTRRMLDETARAKGRERMLLGVRVGPMLTGPFHQEDFPGAHYGNEVNRSCRDLGLDVSTWVEEELVDYVCPSLFWPRWPGLPKTREFGDLVGSRDIGIYPTLFPRPKWLKKGKGKEPLQQNDSDRLLRYKNEFCQHALKLYEDGADGISTYNWYFHLQMADVPNLWTEYYMYGPGGAAVQAHLLSILGDQHAIRRYLNSPPL